MSEKDCLVPQPQASFFVFWMFIFTIFHTTKKKQYERGTLPLEHPIKLFLSNFHIQHHLKTMLD
eukprot:GDKH01007124.1.p1 GENE.GDKH01007124.1~~GDKH01007124.1.p1  ORF type:complete len:64 (-),score=0.93 GDKH01007124.1:108-299(-)